MSQTVGHSVKNLGRPWGEDPRRQLSGVEASLRDPSLGSASQTSLGPGNDDPNRSVTAEDARKFQKNNFERHFAEYLAAHAAKNESIESIASLEKEKEKDQMKIWTAGHKAWDKFVTESSEDEGRRKIWILAQTHASHEDWESMSHRLRYSHQAIDSSNTSCRSLVKWLEDVTRLYKASQEGDKMSESDALLHQYAQSSLAGKDWVSGVLQGTQMYLDYKKELYHKNMSQEATQSTQEHAGVADGDAETEA